MAHRFLRTGTCQRLIASALAFVMAAMPSLQAWAQTPGAKESSTAKPSRAIDATYITSGASAAVVLRPAQLMKSPMSEFLPVEVATAAGEKYLGVDPANIEQVLLYGDVANPTAPTYGIVFKFSTPFNLASIPPELRGHTESAELAGKTYLQSKAPMLPSFFAPDDHQLVVAPEETMRRLVEFPDPAKSGAIIDRLKKLQGENDAYVAVNVTGLRPLVQMGLATSNQPIPPEAKPLLDALNLIDSAELTLNLSKPGTSSLVAHANDAASAEKVEVLIHDAAAKYQDQMKAAVAEQAKSEDPVERAMAHYAERVSGRWTQPFIPTRDGADLTFFRADTAGSQQQQLVAVAVVGILVALLLPAFQAAREACAAKRVDE